jgi:hypothetical protein
MDKSIPYADCPSNRYLSGSQIRDILYLKETGRAAAFLLQHAQEVLWIFEF